MNRPGRLHALVLLLAAGLGACSDDTTAPGDGSTSSGDTTATTGSTTSGASTTSTGDATGGAGGEGGGSSSATGAGGSGGSGGGEPVSRCVLPAEPRLAVADFGAAGDGVTDDTEALQAALEALEAGGTLELEPGATYLISDQLELRGSGVGLDGQGATLFMADGTPTTRHKLLAMIDCNDCQVADLVVDGNRDGRVPAEASGAHAVGVAASHDFAFCNVDVRGSTCDGFYVSAGESTDPTTYSSRGVFEECDVDDSYRQGMSIINAIDIQILGGSYSGTNGTAPEAGIDLEPNDGSASPGITDILIRGVLFENNTGAGVTGGGSVRIARVTIEDSTFVNNATGTATGFRVGFEDALVQRNTFRDHGETATSGVLVFRGSDDTNNVVVRDNLFVDNTNTTRVVEIAGTGPATFFIDNTFTNNAAESVNTHGITTTCIAGTVTDGVEEDPGADCGALPDVGYAPEP